MAECLCRVTQKAAEEQSSRPTEVHLHDWDHMEAEKVLTSWVGNSL